MTIYSHANTVLELNRFLLKDSAFNVLFLKIHTEKKEPDYRSYFNVSCHFGLNFNASILIFNLFLFYHSVYISTIYSDVFNSIEALANKNYVMNKPLLAYGCFRPVPF